LAVRLGADQIPWDGLGFVAPADFARAPRIDAVAQVRTR
jgi:hypothetical protein